MDLEQKILSNVAIKLSDNLCKKIARQTIRWMQGQNTAIDIGYLENLWDDVCYQLQAGRSYSWNHYDFAIMTYVISKLEELNKYEANAIWLQTDNAYDHLVDMEDKGIAIDSRFTPMRSPPYVDDMARYIVNEYIYSQADTWQNDRLRQLLGSF